MVTFPVPEIFCVHGRKSAINTNIETPPIRVSLNIEIDKFYLSFIQIIFVVDKFIT